MRLPLATHIIRITSSVTTNPLALLRKLFKLFSAAVLVGVIGLSVLWLSNKDGNFSVIVEHASNIVSGKTGITGNRTPGELIRYVKRRLEGHNNLETVLLPPLYWLQAQYERPIPAAPLPTLGKGQKAQPLTLLSDVNVTDVRHIATSAELAQAVRAAKAGQTLLLAPGTYRIGKTLKTAAGGNHGSPITLMASQPGQVVIEVAAVVGFNVSHPYWVFENLIIRGLCEPAKYCEHAFHVFGLAQGVVIRNNRIEDFNAHLKINGSKGNWPDGGLVQYNTITNSQPRHGKSSVTPIDLVGADGWKILDNIISNFVKYGGNQISYGVFMKGNSHYGRIERNIIICASENMSQPGIRVGISYGGGTTGKRYCRDEACEVEHTLGLAANNIVAHCNDFGIDVNLAKDITIAHNTLINTAGIDVRGNTGDAKIYGNLLDGLILARNGGQIQERMNETVPMATYLTSPDSLNLQWLKRPENIPSLPFVETDFCALRRLDGTPPGAITTVYACD